MNIFSLKCNFDLANNLIPVEREANDPRRRYGLLVDVGHVGGGVRVDFVDVGLEGHPKRPGLSTDGGAGDDRVGDGAERSAANPLVADGDGSNGQGIGLRIRDLR